jgi:sn-glycerol 3-phosphate transport system substrate-binding protein
MSRLWTVIGIGILALALAACGGGGGEESTTPAVASPTGAAAETAETATPTGTVSIDFWHSEVASTAETLQRLVDRFNASQDEVKVNLLYQGNNVELILKLITSIQSHNVPALVELAEVDTQIAVDSGGVTPVQKFIDAEGYDLSDFDQKAIDYYTVDDQLYAVPFGIAVPMLFYNKIPFREVGLDPEQPPLTIDDIKAYSEKLYKEDGAGNVVRSGIALDMNPWYLEVLLAEHGDLYVNNNNGRDGRPTEALFDNDAGKTVFRWWKEMVDGGLGFNVGRNPSGADALLAMGAGRTAMAVSGSSALRSVLDVLEAGLEGVELGVGPFPAVPGGTGVPGIFGRSLWIMNGRPEEEQEAAWKVAPGAYLRLRLGAVARGAGQVSLVPGADRPLRREAGDRRQPRPPHRAVPRGARRRGRGDGGRGRRREGPRPGPGRRGLPCHRGASELQQAGRVGGPPSHICGRRPGGRRPAHLFAPGHPTC